MTITGADVIAEGLASLGVRRAWGIISIHNMPMFDAIRRRGVTRITDTSHEQAATHAADGYARVTGELGVVIGSTGPGTTNTFTGLCEAKVACSQVLLVTGQSETGFLGKGLGYIHELDNQAQLLGDLGIPVASPRGCAEIGCIVINDGGYGVLRGLQAARFEGRWDNTDLGVIDFAKLAEGLGVRGRRVKTSEGFSQAAREGFETDGPYLIDFDITGLTPMAGQLLPQRDLIEK